MLIANVPFHIFIREKLVQIGDCTYLVKFSSLTLQVVVQIEKNHRPTYTFIFLVVHLTQGLGTTSGSSFLNLLHGLLVVPLQVLGHSSVTTLCLGSTNLSTSDLLTTVVAHRYSVVTWTYHWIANTGQYTITHSPTFATLPIL